VNIHSIHNYKLIAAVVPQDLLAPFTSVNGNIIALKKKAAALVRGDKQPNNGDAAQPTDDSDPLPFDQGGTKNLVVADKDTLFKGHLSSQTKLELKKMASVLCIPVLEKDRKQELTLKVQEYLEANPDVRNNTQFIQLTWQPVNRKATTLAPPKMASKSLPFPCFLIILTSPCRWSNGIKQLSCTICTIAVYSSHSAKLPSPYDAMVSDFLPTDIWTA
jgi:hypothetical protein